VPLAACCQCGVRHGRTSRPWHPRFIESALAGPRGFGVVPLPQRYNRPMVRPERIAPHWRSGSCRIELAGASPTAVSTGAPRSRPRATGETLASEWGVKSPRGAVRLHGGEPVRRPSRKRTLQPSEIGTRKVGSAEPLISRRRQSRRAGTARPGARQDARGAGRRACGHSSVRNRRDPSRRPTLGVGDPYKPMAKGDRVGRESQGAIVPLTAREKAGRGKGPCFDR
jgi:hypothetical protein